jgi:hypothetical protein
VLWPPSALTRKSARIRSLDERTRSTFLRHSWALVALRSAPYGRNAMRHMEQCLEALAETSMWAKEKVTLLVTIDDFVFALRAAAADPRIDFAFARAEIASGAFPRLVETFAGGPCRAERGSLRARAAGAARSRGEPHGLMRAGRDRPTKRESGHNTICSNCTPTRAFMLSARQPL